MEFVVSIRGWEISGIVHEFITILDQLMEKEKVDVGTWLNKLESANHRMML